MQNYQGALQELLTTDDHAPNPHDQQLLTRCHDYSSGKSCHGGGLHVRNKNKLPASPPV